MSKKQKLLLCLVMLITIAWAAAGVFTHKIIGGYDPSFHSGRIQALADNIQAGHFPNPIGTKYLGGLGYGVGFFYGNFWLYPFAMLIVHGMQMFFVYQLMLLCLMIAAVCSITFVVWKLTHRFYAVLVAAPLYVLNNYYISVVFGRAAVGETFAFVFMPLIILGVVMVAQEKRNGWLVLSWAMAALLVSHVLSFVLALVFVALFALSLLPRMVKRPQIVAHFVVAGINGALLAAAFWMSLQQQLKVQKYHDTSLLANGKPIVLHSPLGIFSALDPSYHHQGGTGIALLVLGMLCLVLMVVVPKLRPNWYMARLAIAGLLTAIPIYSFTVTRWLYNLVPGIKTFQSIWRLNVLLIPLITICVAYTLANLLEQQQFPIRLLGTGIVLLAVVLAYLPARGAQISFITERAPLNRETRTQYAHNYSVSMGEYEPAAYVKHHDKQKLPEIMAAQPGVTVVSNNSKHLVLNVTSTVSQRVVHVPRLYYLGYRYRLEDSNGYTEGSGPLTKGNDGLGEVRVPLSEGPQRIVVTYQTTVMAKLGLLITGFAALLNGFVVLNKLVGKRLRRMRRGGKHSAH